MMQVSDSGQAGAKVWKASAARARAVSMIVEWENHGDEAGELADSMFQFICRFLSSPAHGDENSLFDEQ